METDEYSCSGSGEGACKRIAGTKLSKKSYKETCKFTINRLGLGTFYTIYHLVTT